MKREYWSIIFLSLHSSISFQIQEMEGADAGRWMEAGGKHCLPIFHPLAYLKCDR